MSFLAREARRSPTAERGVLCTAVGVFRPSSRDPHHPETCRQPRFSLPLIEERNTERGEKKIGAAKHSESIRSRMPPWPSMIAPKSFTPTSRLIALITRPPAKPSRAITRDIPAASSGVNGVAHQSAAPSAVDVSTPPRKPSQVLVGLTTFRIRSTGEVGAEGLQ